MMARKNEIIMNKYIFTRWCTVLTITCLLWTSCTKDFKEVNVDPAKLTSVGERELPFLFSKAESAASYTSYAYQVAQNLFADLYAQYFATTVTYFPSDRYVMRYDWLATHWSMPYTQVVPQLQSIFEFSKPESPEYALANIIWVYTFHRLTDYYGPVPYFHAGATQKTIDYDAQDKIYEDFFKRLAAAVNTLKTTDKQNIFGSYDLIYGGSREKWLRFANTLRLRLALRISKVNATKARQEAEAAVADGVMTELAHDAYMIKSVKGTDINGLAGISEWNEFSMSAAMESMLKGYKDPRLAVFFQPAANTGKFSGIRNGVPTTAITTNEKNKQKNLSNIGTRWVAIVDGQWVSNQTVSQDIMHAAEAYFLRAEGALNGWNMNGTPKDLYEKGIEMSMLQWKIEDPAVISAYIQSEGKPVALDDYLQSPPVNQTVVKWGSNTATQRMQIGTQKWLALYPDGMEAWAEVRRSGYPVLYPLVSSDNSDLPVGTPIKRIPFIDLEKQTNAAAVQKAIPLLNGPDKASTRLWWDVD